MPDPGRVEYEPRSVKDLLGEMKDTAELLIDLSYSSVLFEDGDLADEVLELEARMDVLQLQARMSLVMAGRSPADAEALAPVFGIVGAAEKVSDAAGDIAKVVREEVGLLPALRYSLPDAVETLARATVVPDSPYVDRTLGEIDLETETGVRVVAVRRAEEWIHSPDRDTAIRAGDVLICRGPDPAIDGVYETVTGAAFERPDAEQPAIADLDRAVESLVLMKNVSELAVDLAYSSVLFDSPALAEEVRELEVEVDALQSRFEAWVLQAAGAVEDPVELRGMLHIAASTEVVSDAAVEISEGVLRGLSTHPVVQAAVEESDEVIERTVVAPDSDLAGETIEDVLRDAAAGLRVIAIRRGPPDRGEREVGETAGEPAAAMEGRAAGETVEGTSEWLLTPAPQTELGAGDHLITKGTRAGVERLAALAT